jgi:hypothetical protein
MLVINRPNLETHSFREAVRRLLRKHFSERIADRFELVFEAQRYSSDEMSIWQQNKADTLILEVYYVPEEGTKEYVCDLHSWQSQSQVESKLLRYVTDKYKSGVIGGDWMISQDRIDVNPVIEKGIYETPDG